MNKQFRILHFAFCILQGFLVCSFDKSLKSAKHALADVPTLLIQSLFYFPSSGLFIDIVWSISDAGETGATISANVLKTTKNGTVKVKATVANGVGNGQDFTKEYTIEVNALTSGYVEYSLNGTVAVPNPKPMPTEYTGVDSAKTTWSDGWYVVNNKVTIDSRITVTGTVNLILVDGATLTASKGISVNSGNALNIFGQQQGTGKLIATNNDQNNSTIGGDNSRTGCGTVNIHGGTISVTKELGSNTRAYGAAIGGGGTISIYAGTVGATSHADGAAIGGKSGEGANIKIYGGAVTATSNGTGAAIGSGLYGSDNNIAIHGGTVVARVEREDDGFGAAIGGGYGATTGGNITITDGTVTATGNGSDAYRREGGSAGIGGGDQIDYTTNGQGGIIVISGGTVTATGGYGAAGIGGGYWGPGGSITISGGTITATGGNQAAGIGGGYQKSGGTITITGGNIKAVAGSGAEAIGKGKNSTTTGTLTNAEDSALTLNAITLNGAAADTNVTVTNGITYGLNDVKTLDTNKLYFYLPANTVATSITAGGAEYFCKDQNSLTYYTSHDWSNKDGVCVHCGEICEHEGQEYTCSICGANLHEHEWEYTVSGTTITATCKNTDNNCISTDGGYVTIAVPSSLTYTGSKIEAVVENTLTTGATVNVVYTGNTSDGYPVNAGEYTASITLGDETISVKYTIEKAVPTANDFVFTAPTDLIYDGYDKEATVTVKDGIVGMGEIKVMYYRYASGIWIDNERAPRSPGRYKVGIWLTEGENYKDVTSAERIWLGDEFEIKYLETSAEADVSGTKGANGWYTSTVTLKAPDGYAISKSIYDTYGESLTFASEQNETVTYYLQNLESGKIAEKTIELKIDLTDPTAEYAINDNGWRKFINFISFGIFCKDNADLSITANDTMDSNVTVQYVVSTEKLTPSEITDWNDYSDKVALNPKAKNYIYIKVTDDAGRTVVYESGVVVFADSTASAEIEYTKHSTEDVTAQIVFNGNTVKEVKYGDTALTANDYTVTDNGIQFEAEYLNTFAAGNYSFVVTYNPVGESWTESADGIANDTVGTTTIELTVKKATLTITGATLADKTYDGTTSGTVSGVTFGETDKLALGTDYTATVVYDSENAGSRTATVTVTLKDTDKANAYALESNTYTLDATIAQRQITVTATEQTITYGENITADAFTSANVLDGHKLDVTLTPSTADVTVSGTITVTVNDITVNGESAKGNYDVSVSSGKLTIQPDLSGISDLTAENVTSADKADIEAVKEMMRKADYDNADEETKAAWNAIVDNGDALLDKIKAVADEIDRVTAETGSYDADTVNSDDAADLNELAADIKALTDSNNLTDEERTALNALAETVTALQKVIADTAAESTDITNKVGEYKPESVKSDDTQDIEDLIDRIDTLLDGDNLTEDERAALEETKGKAQDLLDKIDEAANADDTKNTEAAV